MPEVHLNEPLLRRLVEAVSHIEHGDALRPASIDGLLGVRGVVEIRDTGDEETDPGTGPQRRVGGVFPRRSRLSLLCAGRRARP